MIIITGPGRSGTSFLAAVYREAGLDPGGAWEDRVRAGLEDPAVTALNDSIMRALGVTALGARMEPPELTRVMPSGVAARIKRAIPQERRKAMRRRLRNAQWNRARAVRLIPWQEVPGVATRFGEELRAYAETHVLVKDPRFSWTLPVWVAAGAAIDHVVVTSREIEKMIESRAAAEHLAFAKDSDARNAMIYALGVALTSAWDAEVPTTQLRFPDLLARPEESVAALPLAGGVDRAALAAAFASVAEPRPASVTEQ